jgi:hypothetical protein
MKINQYSCTVEHHTIEGVWDSGGIAALMYNFSAN